MWPDRVSNPGPLTYESDVLPTGLRGPAVQYELSLVSLTWNRRRYDKCHLKVICHLFSVKFDIRN